MQISVNISICYLTLKFTVTNVMLVHMLWLKAIKKQVMWDIEIYIYMIN